MGEDVESVMGGVRMGVNVDIKRTDGEYIRYITNINTSGLGQKTKALCCWFYLSSLLLYISQERKLKGHQSVQLTNDVKSIF